MRYEQNCKYAILNFYTVFYSFLMFSFKFMITQIIFFSYLPVRYNHYIKHYCDIIFGTLGQLFSGILVIL